MIIIRSIVSWAIFFTQPCVDQLFKVYLAIFVPSIHACSKRAASAFVYSCKLLTWSHKPDPFCSTELDAHTCIYLKWSMPFMMTERCGPYCTWVGQRNSERGSRLHTHCVSKSSLDVDAHICIYFKWSMPFISVIYAWPLNSTNAYVLVSMSSLCCLSYLVIALTRIK